MDIRYRKSGNQTEYRSASMIALGTMRFVYILFASTHLFHTARTLSSTNPRLSVNYNMIASAEVNDELPQLPAVSEHSEDLFKSLELNGNSVSMEELGPIIINIDGTTRRISNWNTLTKHEKETTFRLIKERNKKRLDRLREKRIDPSL